MPKPFPYLCRSPIQSYERYLVSFVLPFSYQCMPTMNTRCVKTRHMNTAPKCVYTVLAFGDSNTWGFDPASPGNGAATLRHPYIQRWTTQLGEILDKQVHIIPEGLNARTTIIRDPMSPCDGKENVLVHGSLAS